MSLLKKEVKSIDQISGRAVEVEKASALSMPKHFFARYVSKVILLPMYISKVQKTRLLIY